MTKIAFVDTTFRDAQQSLWGERMNTAMMRTLAPMMNRAGFKAMDATAISHLEFAVRYHREDPWERIRLLSNLIPDVPLAITMPSRSITIFTITSGPLKALFMRRLAANGIRRVQLGTTTGAYADSVEYAKQAGLEVVMALPFCLSPVHTDGYFEKKVREIVALSPDGVYIKDPGGLLTPERVRTLVPAIQKHLGGLPLEIHSHCTTGLAPICYAEAMKLGVRTFHTAVSPLANGPSQPSIENTLNNARSLGCSSDVDEEALGAISRHLGEIARAEGLPIGTPLEYDASQYEHQIPGGVISNLKRQLAELGREDRLEEVLQETVAVRREFGYPIMITPFSQFVVTQATLNVIQGERYKTVPDEVIRFALGHYVDHEIPMDQGVLDMIMSMPRTKELEEYKPEEVTMESLRRHFGGNLAEDDLLLLCLCKKADFDAMRRAGPSDRGLTYPLSPRHRRSLIGSVLRCKKLHYVKVETEDIYFSAKRHTRGADG